MNQNDILRNLYKKSIEFSSIDVLIDDVPCKALIRECSDGATNMIDYKTIISNTSFKQGSKVGISDFKYLIIDIEEQFTQDVYNKGTMRKAQNIQIGELQGTSLKNSYSALAIVDKNNSAIINSDMISLLNDEMMFIVPFDSRVKINDFILYKNNIFKITSLDNSKDGLLTLIAKFNTTSASYSISLVENNISKEIGNTYQINVVCKANNVIVDNPVVIYKSNNQEIATVDDSGLVSCIGEGTTNIVCTYENVSVIFTINVNVIEVVNYTIDGAETLKINTTSVYTVSPQVGNIEIVLDDYSNEYGIAEIVESTEYSVTIKALVSDDIATVQVLQNGEVKAEKYVTTTKR